MLSLLLPSARAHARSFMDPPRLPPIYLPQAIDIENRRRSRGLAPIIAPARSLIHRLEPLVLVPRERAETDAFYYISSGTVLFRGFMVGAGSSWGADCVLADPKLRRFAGRAITYTEVWRFWPLAHRMCKEVAVSDDHLFGMLCECGTGAFVDPQRHFICVRIVPPCWNASSVGCGSFGPHPLLARHWDRAGCAAIQGCKSNWCRK